MRTLSSGQVGDQLRRVESTRNLVLVHKEENTGHHAVCWAASGCVERLDSELCDRFANNMVGHGSACLPDCIHDDDP